MLGARCCRAMCVRRFDTGFILQECELQVQLDALEQRMLARARDKPYKP